MRRSRRSSVVQERAPALGYTSVPHEGARAEPEARAQQLAIAKACERLGLELVDLVRDEVAEGKEGDPRPGLAHALERIETGEASCLVVTGLGRLGGPVAELAPVLDRIEQDGVRLIALDVGLDTATSSGQLALKRRPIEHMPWEPPERIQPPAATEAPAAEVAAVEQAEIPEAEPAELAVEQSAPTEAPPAEVAVEQTELPEEEPASAAPPEPEPPAPEPRRAVRALGYASVPADADAEGPDLEAQRQAIERSCARQGFELVEVIHEREPQGGKALDRPGLSYALERIAAGEASCLIATGLDRLSRSVPELGTLVRWLERNDVRLLALDVDLDTASPGGRTTARTLASVAGWESERLSERTRKGLAAARAKRHAATGATATDWAAISKRIAAMRADGMTLQAIADVLNEEGVPTQRGGAKWRPSSVQTAAGYKRRTRAKGVDDLPRGPSDGDPG